MFAVMFFPIKLISRIIYIPKQRMYPIILLMCVVGAYAANYGVMFDVWSLIVFAIVGEGHVEGIEHHAGQGDHQGEVGEFAPGVVVKQPPFPAGDPQQDVKEQRPTPPTTASCSTSGP